MIQIKKMKTKMIKKKMKKMKMMRIMKIIINSKRKTLLIMKILNRQEYWISMDLKFLMKMGLNNFLSITQMKSCSNCIFTMYLNKKKLFL